MNSATLTTAGLSLGSATAWGGGDFSGGLATKRADVFRVVAYAHAFGFLLMLGLAWLTREPVPGGASLVWGVAAGIAGGFGIAALYKALAIGRMGIIAPVAAVITGVLPVLVGISTEGLPDRIQLAGFGLALVSIWLIARPDGEIDTHRGLGLAVLAGVMFGLFLIAGRQAGHGGVFWPLVAARAASTVLMALIVAFSARDTRPLSGALMPILLSGLGDSMGNALFIAASRHGRLDVAAVLSSLYPASTVILARVLLKERISPMQNAGIVGALVAVALISAR
jgi:drug/metabolite transporter (DMT)-like permease